jgi:mycothiol system anti-sigma-R factor
MSDCKDALHQLYDFLDGELTADKKAAIQHHLDSCQPCAEPYDFEAELRLVVRKKCAEAVPESLMAKIRKAIEAEPVPPATSAGP